MEKLLTVQEIVEKLQLHENTVYHYLQSGKIKGYKIGEHKLWRAYESDVDKFVKEESND